MSNPVVTGPAFNCQSHRQDHECDVSFRVVKSYDIATDSNLARFDVLSGGVQMNGGLFLGRGTELVFPKGSYEGFSAKVNSGDLVALLRGLADRLEEQLAANVEAMKP